MDLLELVAKITLDSSEYESGLKNMKSQAEKQADGIRKGLLGATAAGAAAVAAFVGSSVKTGAAFDSSMAQVAATMGLSMSEVQNKVGETETVYGHFEGSLRDFAMFMGENTVYSATQAADALNYMALAGYDVNESMMMLPNVMNLASAGAMDLARASDVVTDVQTAFGLEMEEMPQLIDEMARAASTGNTSVEQLGDAFLTIGGYAQELNGGFVTLADGTQEPVSGINELEIALTAMANAGIKGSEAGTHMRNMLQKLTGPSKDGAAQLEAMGVKIFDAEGKLRSLSDIFSDFSAKMETMTQEEKIQAISDLFNTRDLASAEALLNAVGQDWDKIGESILDAANGGVLYNGKLYSMEEAQAKFGDAIYDTEKGFQILGSAEAMALTQNDNLAGDIKLLNSALEKFKITLSDKVTPAIRTLVQGATSLIQNFEKYKPIILGAATAFGTFAVAVNIVSIIQKVGVALKALMLVFTTGTGPIGLIIAAIAGLVTWFITAYKTNDEFREKVNNALESIKEHWESFKEKISAGAEELKQDWENIKEAFATVGEWFSEKWDALKEGWANMVEKFKAGGEELRQDWENIKTFFTELWETIKTTVTEKIDAIKTSISEKFNTIKDTISDIIEKIKGIFNFEWSFPKPKMPHFEVEWNDLGIIKIPSVSVDWYKKAYDNPYMFTKPTMMGFGDGVGGEMVYGHNSLLNDIKTAMLSVVGDEQPTTIIVQSVLDGRVIGETATKWQRRQARAFG